MRLRTVFILAIMLSIIAFIGFSTIEEYFLGSVLGGIIIIWPTIYWLVSKLFENISKKPEKIKKVKEPKESEEISNEEIIKEIKAPKVDEEHLRDIQKELDDLEENNSLLDDEYKQNLITKESYDELKNENSKKILKIKYELAKVSGEEVDIVYCLKGQHYISINETKPSKVKGYVTCPEHNEDIRIE